MIFEGPGQTMSGLPEQAGRQQTRTWSLSGIYGRLRRPSVAAGGAGPHSSYTKAIGSGVGKWYFPS